MNKSEFIRDKFLQIDIELNDVQIQQFITFYELLIERNKVMNLTAITEFQDVVMKHFIDSVLICRAVSMNQFENLIDVGTGAGFPGIPLKIVYPDLSVTLLDSLNKRISFLNDVIESCNFVHVKTIHGRAEDFGVDEAFREMYDLCISRAVANLSTLSELCIPFIKPGGYFVSYKADNIMEEMKLSKNAIYITGGSIERVEKVILPDTEVKRNLLFIKKVSETPDKYPRRPGIPSKKPL